MKQITKSQLEQIAKDYGMNSDIDEFTDEPSIYNFWKGKAFGFKATQVEGENISGFTYFGDSRFESDLSDVWNEIN